MATIETEKKDYSAREVKVMAEAKGLPCRVVKRKGVEHVQPLSTLESLGLVRVWSRFMTVPQLAEDTFSRIERAN